MNEEKVLVAIYENNLQAKQAVKKLQKSGFDMEKLSIIGKDYYTEQHAVGYYNIGNRMRKWGSIGAFWGSIWGLLLGSAFFLIPGIGPLLIAGPFVSSLIGALEGAVTLGSLTALGAALVSIGIPNDSVMVYETEVKAGRFLLLAHGYEPEVQRAKETLGIETKIRGLIAKE